MPGPQPTVATRQRATTAHYEGAGCRPPLPLSSATRSRQSVGRGLDPSAGFRPTIVTGSSVGEGFIPPGLCAHIAAQHKKAGANISFAPAVLLLRSHSLITLFVIFRTASASSWESSYLYANFDCPFKTLTNCSLDLPSGSLFAQKHLWNGVMFVIKIVLGVMGLMPRTKAS